MGIFKYLVIVVLLCGLTCFLILGKIPSIYGSDINGDKIIGEHLSLSLRTIDGNILNLDSFEGKIVLIKFWATWSTPCIMEFEELKKVCKEYGDNLVVITIAIDKDTERVRNFIERNNIEWFVVIDHDNTYLKTFNIDTLPTIILLNKEGIIVSKITGYQPYELLKEYIDTLIKG